MAASADRPDAQRASRDRRRHDRLRIVASPNRFTNR
jgi:hypothetical protein